MGGSASAHTAEPGKQRDRVVDPPLDITAEDFKAAFRGHAGGVAVITADIGEGPVGLTATSVTSVSAEPPLLMFSVSEQSSSTPTLLEADTVVVHLLTAQQLDIAKLCATSGIDRFADTSTWVRLATGEPLFHSAHAWLRCRIVNKMSAAGSTIIVAQALQAVAPDPHDPSFDATSERPLVYHNRTWHALGKHSRL